MAMFKEMLQSSNATVVGGVGAKLFCDTGDNFLSLPKLKCKKFKTIAQVN